MVWIGARIEIATCASVATQAGWEGGEVGGLAAVWAGRKEGDCDGELGGQEEAEVDQSGCRE